mgnify:FL=1
MKISLPRTTLSKRHFLMSFVFLVLVLFFPKLDKYLNEIAIFLNLDKGVVFSVEDEEKVERVVDGDTIVIASGEKVRLIGIDAPESVKSQGKPECFGVESSSHLRYLAEGKVVTLQRDVSDRDRYGRLLRYVFLEGRLLNEMLVEEGYARAKSYSPDTAREEQLKRAEKLAQSAQKGIWKECEPFEVSK